MKHKLFLFLAAIGIFLPLAADAETFEVDGIKYETTDETSVSVTSNVYSGDIVIPTSVKYGGATYNVTSIGERAFYRCSGLTSVTIPNSVTSIGGSAFCDCRGLTSITIPNSVTTIGGQAFYDCSSLTSVTIPNSVTTIGVQAFYCCSGLTSITIPNSMTSIGGHTFENCSGLTSITIPNSVTSIGNMAFSGCRKLSSVKITDLKTWCSISGLNNLMYNGTTKNLYLNDEEIINLVIPEGATSITSYAFYKCNSLTSITIPNSVMSIGENAFSSCSGLTSITIGNGVTSIESNAFSSCSKLCSIKITDLKTWCSISGLNNLMNYGTTKKLYFYDEEISSLVIPEGITSITSSAFNNCPGLASVTIGSSVTSIGDYAFSGCSGLTSITIPNSVSGIGSYAFYNCNSLTSVTIDNSVTSIGSSAFYGCNAIKEVYAKPLVPPTYGDKTFDDNVCTTATLYIPNTNNCFTRYSGKEGWNNFRNIVEYDMSLLDEDPDGKPCATPTIAYKDGKLVFNSTTSGAEYHSNITAQDAGTGITSGSELKLAATYDISVYATAEGCARSASAYATLAFNLDGSGTEEEGIISVMASPVLINAEGGTLYVSGLTNATEVEYFTLEGRALGRSMVKDGCTMFTTDQPKGSTLIVTVNGRGAKVVVR